MAPQNEFNMRLSYKKKARRAEDPFLVVVIEVDARAVQNKDLRFPLIASDYP